MYKLSNGRVEVGPEEDRILQEELDRINKRLAEISPQVERDISESRKRHKKLWNY